MPISGADLEDALPGLLRYGLFLTRDQQAAEDLVQDTALRALERGATFAEASSAATWLHRVLHNRFIDQTRARTPEPIDDDHLALEIERRWRADEYSVDPEAVLLRAETRDDLRDALVHLPVIYRSAVVLHDAEGFTVREIAEIQGVELPAAKQRLRRGRQMLVTALAEGAELRVALDGVPLRCWDARSRVGDYIDGELSAAERQELERHLTGCPTCPGLYASLVSTRTAVGALRDPDTVIPPGLRERLRAVER